MERGIQFYAWVESIISPEHMPSEYNKCDLKHYKFYEFLIRNYLEWAWILAKKHN